MRFQPSRPDDAEEQRAAVDMLSAVLEQRERLDERELEAFEQWSMRLPRGGKLTPRQMDWLRSVAARLDVVTQAINDWSSRSPAEQQRIRGREVPPPAVLRRENLPMAPPGRRRS